MKENGMKSFRDFLKEEQTHIDIEVELKNAPVGDIEKINEDLDAVTVNPFVNSVMFVNTIRGTLERYGILLPAHSNLQQLALEGEYVYKLGESGQYVYMVHNLSPEGTVEGYANIVTGEELDDLSNLGDSDDDPEVGTDSQPKVSDWTRYPKARRDDDSGNSNEY
jgi:hypothetical protein